MSVEVILLAIVTLVVLSVWTLISVKQKKQDKEWAGNSYDPSGSPKTVAESMSDTSGEGSSADKEEETFNEPVLERKPVPGMSAPASRQGRRKQIKKSMKFNAMPVRIVITGILLIAALVVILSNHYDGDSKNWAFGVVGTILGYWLKADKS